MGKSLTRWPDDTRATESSLLLAEGTGSSSSWGRGSLGCELHSKRTSHHKKLLSAAVQLMQFQAKSLKTLKAPECLGPLKVLTCRATSARNPIPKGWRLKGTHGCVTSHNSKNEYTTLKYGYETPQQSKPLRLYNCRSHVSNTWQSLKTGDFPIKRSSTMTVINT